MPGRVLRSGNESYPPLICVHPATGDSRAYASLAAHLRWPGEIVGIDARGLSTGEDVSSTSFRSLARGYADEIETARAALLLGWQLGGVLAAEVAVELAERGADIAFVGVLDGRVPQQPELRSRPMGRDVLARYMVSHVANVREIEVEDPPRSSSPADILATLRGLGITDFAADEADLERRFAVFRSVLAAFADHDQRPCPIGVHLFESRDELPSHPRPATLGWENVAPSVERRLVDGTHFTLLAERYCPALAGAIDGAISRCSVG